MIVPGWRWQAAAAAALVLGAIGAAADWPVFRGDALQRGVAPGPLPEPLEIIWKFKAKDAVEGAAAIAGGAAYIGCNDEYLYSLDVGNGHQLWAVKLGAIKASPGYRQGAIYVGDLDGILHCVDAATGRERWRFEAGAEVTSAPSFAGDRVLFGSGDEHLYCLSGNGKLVWKFKVAGGPVLASPAIAEGRTFVSGCDSTLHVLDSGSGRELGSINLDGQTGATPAVFGDQLFVGTMTNQVIAVDWRKPEVAWRYESERHAKPFYASAAVNEALVVVGGRDKMIRALERRTGKEVWAFPTGGNVDASPVIVGTRVLAASLDGNLYVLDLAKGTEVRRIKLGPTSASPAVAGGRVVIGTEDGTVYGLGSRTRG